jgi:hypothetical protein
LYTKIYLNEWNKFSVDVLQKFLFGYHRWQITTMYNTLVHVDIITESKCTVYCMLHLIQVQSIHYMYTFKIYMKIQDGLWHWYKYANANGYYTYTKIATQYKMMINSYVPIYEYTAYILLVTPHLIGLYDAITIKRSYCSFRLHDRPRNCIRVHCFHFAPTYFINYMNFYSSNKCTSSVYLCVHAFILMYFD